MIRCYNNDDADYDDDDDTMTIFQWFCNVTLMHVRFEHIATSIPITLFVYTTFAHKKAEHKRTEKYKIRAYYLVWAAVD